MKKKKNISKEELKDVQDGNVAVQTIEKQEESVREDSAQKENDIDETVAKVSEENIENQGEAEIEPEVEETEGIEEIEKTEMGEETEIQEEMVDKENDKRAETNLKPEKQEDAEVLNLEEQKEDNLDNENEEQSLNGEKLQKRTVPKWSLKRHAIVIGVISVILIIAVVVFSTIFALMNKGSEKIVNGVSVKGIDVSGLTKQEAKDKLNDSIKPNLEQDISLVHGEYTTAIIPNQIEANFGVDLSVELAYNIGRAGNILTDNYTIINAYLNKININPSFSYNQKILEDFIDNISDNLPDKVIQSSYCIEDNNLVISKGQKGYKVQSAELENEIIDNIVNLKQENTIDIPVVKTEPDAIDVEKIRNEIYKEPQDAYYTKDPFTVYPHVDGVDINVSIEEAKNLVANSTEGDITIPLKITTPSVTTNQIGTEAFPNLLATFSTNFSTSNSNRASNIRLSTSKINGVVLMPGEIFSYNQVVGKRTISAGFKEAHAFSNGKVVNEVGGGICQVSSTLYNSVLLSNLEIVERKNHTFNTGYVKLGTDATVSWGGPDFKFKNSRNYPIKIVGKVSGGTVTIQIYGLKEETEYDVVIETEVLQKIPRKVVYQNTTSLATGKQRVTQTGYDGYKTRTYKVLKLNGSVVSRTLLSTDTYSSLQKIIEVGQ